MKSSIQWIYAILLLFCLQACETQNTQEDHSEPPFKLLRNNQTGLDFENNLKQTPEFNVFNYMYFFNGGGVAAGDFNQDGYEDLYFTSNMGSNKLFINEGELKFKEVTAEAKLEGLEGWTSGVTVVDINNDGLLDLYVSQIGDYEVMKGQNQLYVCQKIENGIPVFEEKAASYGLDLVGFSTQAAFFDYDLDGDLDMFQLNHSLHENGTFGEKKSFEGTQHPMSGDKLLRNDNGKFTEVTLEAGIYSTVIGYGLGLAIGDVNLDGWPDIYIGNDFHENDYLYINQQDGTFSEELNQQIRHTSRFSMGVDIADINNDGFGEILSLDMMPEDREILKASLSEDPYDIYSFKLTYGYNQQYARNNLQLNRGNGTFSEIGLYADVFASDWSWAPLFFDFDNDGNKDVFISNGIPRRMNDIDYVNFRANDELRWKQNFNRLSEEDLKLVEKMPQIKLPNKFYRNTGQLQFEDLSDLVINALPSYSNGAVYADFDKDGDLDVVVNNINDKPFLYQNLQTENKPSPNQQLTLDLKGSPNNIHGIGATAIIYKGQEKIFQQNFPVRGYQSSVPLDLYIGVGDPAKVDSLLLIWPDQRYEVVKQLRFDVPTTLEWYEGLPKFDYARLRPVLNSKYPVKDITQSAGLEVRHKENNFVEFLREPLIPHMVSAEGPALAIGDANGDGLDDVFLGSSKWEYSKLLIQLSDGTFEDRTPRVIRQDSTFEDVDAVWVDIENDGDLDLVVASGGNEFRDTNEPLRQRVYINNGQLEFEVDKNIFGETFLTASCVLAEDFNGDGLTDLFFGGRAVPWDYGEIPDSYLFQNKGNGVFEDVTDQIAPELRKAGLIKDGQWTDIDADGDPDIILAAEWSPVLLFINNNGSFDKKSLNEKKGWWNMVLVRDFDQDGDVDILAGNTGENSKLKPTVEQPIRLYINDFDDNGKSEQVLTYYLDGKETPFATYNELTKQMVSLKKKFLYAKDFAKADMKELFGQEKLANSQVLEATHLASYYFENTGSGFESHKLPLDIQLSTLNAAAVLDAKKNGAAEVLLGGNFYKSNIEMGRYDASYGNILTIGKDGSFKIEPVGNLNIRGQVKQIKPLRINDQHCFILAKNDAPLQVLKFGARTEKLVQ